MKIKYSSKNIWYNLHVECHMNDKTWFYCNIIHCNLWYIMQCIKSKSFENIFYYIPMWVMVLFFEYVYYIYCIINIMECQQIYSIIIMSVARIEKTKLCADVYRNRNGRFVKCMLSSKMRNKFSAEFSTQKLQSVKK